MSIEKRVSQFFKVREDLNSMGTGGAFFLFSEAGFTGLTGFPG